ASTAGSGKRRRRARSGSPGGADPTRSTRRASPAGARCGAGRSGPRKGKVNAWLPLADLGGIRQAYAPKPTLCRPVLSGQITMVHAVADGEVRLVLKAVGQFLGLLLGCLVQVQFLAPLLLRVGARAQLLAHQPEELHPVCVVFL